MNYWAKNLKAAFLNFIEINESDQEISKKMLELLKKLYNMTKYKGLDYSKLPLIVAFSAQINQERKNKADEAGFDKCISSPLSVPEFEKLIKKFFDETYVKP